MKYKMPKYFYRGRWVQMTRKTVLRVDIERPCAVCGWAEHMGIHGVPTGTVETPCAYQVGKTVYMHPDLVAKLKDVTP